MISSIIHRAFPQLLSTPTSSPARLGVATLESCHIQHYTYFTSGYNNLHALANNQHALANNLQKSPRFKTSKYILVQFPSAPCCHARIMITGITFWQTINGLFSSQFIILGQPSSPCVWWANIWELYGQGNRLSSTNHHMPNHRNALNTYRSITIPIQPNNEILYIEHTSDFTHT